MIHVIGSAFLTLFWVSLLVWIWWAHFHPPPRQQNQVQAREAWEVYIEQQGQKAEMIGKAYTEAAAWEMGRLWLCDHLKGIQDGSLVAQVHINPVLEQAGADGADSSGGDQDGAGEPPQVPPAPEH